MSTFEFTDEYDIITFDEVTYLVKLARKDSKLSVILHKLLQGVEVELPF